MKSLVVLLAVLIFSCSFFNKELQQTTKGDNEKEYYKILKIDSLNNIYIIYVRKVDSLFKILSLKESTKRCNSIEVDRYYPLKLSSLFPKKFLGKHDLSPESLPYVSGVVFHGTSVQIEKDSINDLHIAENLKGLCFIMNK
jgi:hypothetical protein